MNYLTKQLIEAADLPSPPPSAGGGRDEVIVHVGPLFKKDQQPVGAAVLSDTYKNHDQWDTWEGELTGPREDVIQTLMAWGKLIDENGSGNPEDVEFLVGDAEDLGDGTITLHVGPYPRMNQQPVGAAVLSDTYRNHDDWDTWEGELTGPREDVIQTLTAWAGTAMELVEAPISREEAEEMVNDQN